MSRMATLLVSLLLVLTFNAYACVLPLQTSSQMDCSSGTEEPVRQTCDAFLEIGPHSESGTILISHIANFDYATGVEGTIPSWTVGIVLPPPDNSDTPAHLSIQTTVLRI